MTVSIPCYVPFPTQQLTMQYRNAWLAKVDIEHAYRNIPVHPTDRRWLGMQWDNQLFVDKVLPFGLCSAPKIFSAVADTLEWILCKQGVTSSIHYLDDFLTMGSADNCQRNLQTNLIRGSIAPSSHRTYSSAQRQYVDFCQSINQHPVPVSNQVLILFTACLAQRCTHSTGRTYLAAVRHLNISKVFEDPLMGKLQLGLVLRGLKHLHPRAAHPRLPITPWILNRIFDYLNKDLHSYTNITMWAACGLVYFAFHRSGEFTVPSQNSFDPNGALSPADIAVDDHSCPSIMSIKRKQSKTDRTRQGITLFVGRTGNQLCPITAMLSYLAIRPKIEGPPALWSLLS